MVGVETTAFSSSFCLMFQFNKLRSKCCQLITVTWQDCFEFLCAIFVPSEDVHFPLHVLYQFRHSYNHSHRQQHRLATTSTEGRGTRNNILFSRLSDCLVCP